MVIYIVAKKHPLQIEASSDLDSVINAGEIR
jgi:hypothetical protein